MATASLPGGRKSGEAMLHYDVDRMTCGIETIHLEDDRIQNFWGTQIFRVFFTFSDPGMEGDARFRFTPSVA